MAEPADDGVDGDGEEEIPFIEKIAIVMVALGEEVSGEVMKHLSDYEIEEITQAIAGLKNLSIEVMDRVLEDFETHLMAGEWVGQGGADFARQALERAVGPRKAQEIRVYEIVCVNGLLILGESPLKHDGKSIECSLPISDGHGPLFGDIL